jgi:hypothetical protein
MKVPEVFFAVINPTMRVFLRSPLHALWSRSLMLITFTGRKSGRRYTTPVRYIRIGTTVRCYTSSENQWWRNLRGGADVVLRIEGVDKRYHAIAIVDDPDTIKAALRDYLGLFPQDAAYHDIQLRKDKSLVPEDLERASHNAVVVEAKPIN